MELHKFLETVNDRDSFLAFVKALKEDREDAVRKDKKPTSKAFSYCSNGWQNDTIEEFLEGAHAWAVDSDFGKSHDLCETNMWRMMAEFLYCGKIYE